MAELRVKSTGTLKLFENDNTSSVTIASPASLGADRTVTLPDGDVTLVAGTMSTGGVALTGSTDNTVTTVTGADAIQGETNFIYDGTIVGAGADGANADLGAGLHIKTADSGASVQASGDELVIEGSGDSGMTILSGTSGSASIYFGDSGDDNIASLQYHHGSNYMQFNTNASERMRIASDGKVLINTSSTFADANSLVYLNGETSRKVLYIKIGSNGYDAQRFFNASTTEVGSIQIDSTATVYNTTSDYRLKENETAITDGIERIKQLKPYRFNFKVEPDETKDGFFAHEVSDIVPEAICGEKDAMHPEVLYVEGDELPEGKEIGDVKEETKIDPQGIDQAKLVPLLTSALQEAITKIETLEAKVTALENA